MMTLKKWINSLKYIALKRSTFYDNTFPNNCGCIHQGGVISFDCIGLVKSVINDPSIATRKAPVGFYVQPAQVIPDTTEIGILQLCSEVRWYFNGVSEGEYLYMAGHAGVFVDTFNDGGEVNTIECTTDWGANGVTTSYTDPYSGRRFDHKGGTEMRSWEAHGKLIQYVDYTKKEEEPKKEEKSMFNDVPTTNKYYKYYKKVVDLGLMTKDKNGNFRPNKHITRKHLAIILCRLVALIKKMK